MKLKSIFNFSKRKVTANIKSGLGNQLFQVATVFNYAKRFNFKQIFTTKSQLHEHDGDVGGYTYWHIFNTTKQLNLGKFNRKDFREIYEEYFSYKPFKKTNKNTILNGYFHSLKYVEPVRQQMINLLWSNMEVTNKINSTYKQIISNFKTEDLISIHIRRGDYLKLSNFHTNLSLENYLESIKKYPETYPIIIL